MGTSAVPVRRGFGGLAGRAQARGHEILLAVRSRPKSPAECQPVKYMKMKRRKEASIQPNPAGFRVREDRISFNDFA